MWLGNLRIVADAVGSEVRLRLMPLVRRIILAESIVLTPGVDIAVLAATAICLQPLSLCVSFRFFLQPLQVLIDLSTASRRLQHATLAHDADFPRFHNVLEPGGIGGRGKNRRATILQLVDTSAGASAVRVGGGSLSGGFAVLLRARGKGGRGHIKS